MCSKSPRELHAQFKRIHLQREIRFAFARTAYVVVMRSNAQTDWRTSFTRKTKTVDILTYSDETAHKDDVLQFWIFACTSPLNRKAFGLRKWFRINLTKNIPDARTQTPELTVLDGDRCQNATSAKGNVYHREAAFCDRDRELANTKCWTDMLILGKEKFTLCLQHGYKITVTR